jgi:A/G-specific adenine glycosylase
LEKNLNPFANLPIGHKLTAWYKQNARDLPWRKTQDPYSIFVSEIMLQQTRVEAVKPYYTRFLQALPDIPSLASVQEDTLLKLWEGLGYYSRVRNMQKTAKILMEEHQGQFPKSVEALLKLPGIGPYTAGAVASFAYRITAPAVDGNVLRVLSRLNSSETDIGHAKTRLFAEETIHRMMAGHDPSLFNQSLMELGALICLPHGELRCNSPGLPIASEARLPVQRLGRGYREAPAQNGCNTASLPPPAFAAA